MALNFKFTDKAQATLEAAIQLAKDHANSQGMSAVVSLSLSPVAHQVTYAVYPAHIAFVLLNEGAGDEPAPGNISHTQVPLFASVIQKAGGDVVSTAYYLRVRVHQFLSFQMLDTRKTRI
jgi:ATP-dependent Clp protease ATP-binding subunit ClpB